MNIPQPRFFAAPQGIRPKKLNKSLQPHGFSLDGDNLREFSGIALDTFDSDLNNQGALLVKTAKKLMAIRTGKDLLSQKSAVSPPFFSHKAPDGPVQEWLVPQFPLRALLPAGDVDVSLGTLNLLDDEKKTCCRLEFVEVSHEKNRWAWIKTLPMRGYDDVHEMISSLLDSLDNPVLPGHHLKLALPDYTAKPAMALTPNGTTKANLRLIVGTLMAVARQNEAGVRADWDTEFLHHYRVSLRKVRSVLSLFKGVFSPETEERLKTDFKEIMQETNLLRDRDVYLLAKESYYQLVPPDLYPGLDILFSHLEAERKTAHVSVCAIFESKAYQEQMENLAARFAKGKKLPSGPKAKKPFYDLACRLILKRYAKVCQIAQQITDATPDETIHDLRIEGKKLRYLIEAARPLFDPKSVKRLLKNLKGMQDHLGNFNDQSVQQATLAQCLSTYASQTESGVQMAESIGALTAMLYSRQLEERRLIIENLERFYSPKTQAAFNQLFGKEI